MTDSHVIACIPYHNCRQYIRRAVISLLSQTHKNLTVVVINDADFITPPWPEIVDIVDSRLVRFEMTKNRGPYFATQVSLAATRAPYLLIQDADDWSEPERVSVLLQLAVDDAADFVISSQTERNEYDSVIGMRWENNCGKNSKFYFQPSVTSQFNNRVGHQGLFKIQALKQIGGYYGGFKINYDVFLTNIVLMTCRVAHVERPLYNYFRRKDSLSRGEEFGYHSEERKKVKSMLASMYEIAYKEYCRHLQGDINAADFFSSIFDLSKKNITDEESSALHCETLRLAKLLSI
jgi:glycosyltransferase involved in cell wall biosynthesis